MGRRTECRDQVIENQDVHLDAYSEWQIETLTA